MGKPRHISLDNRIDLNYQLIKKASIVGAFFIDLLTKTIEFIIFAKKIIK